MCDHRAIVINMNYYFKIVKKIMGTMYGIYGVYGMYAVCVWCMWYV